MKSLSKVVTEVEKLLDDAEKFSIGSDDEALSAGEMVSKAYKMLNESPNNWRIENSWRNARTLYNETVRDIDCNLLNRGVVIDINYKV